MTRTTFGSSVLALSLILTTFSEPSWAAPAPSSVPAAPAATAASAPAATAASAPAAATAPATMAPGSALASPASPASPAVEVGKGTSPGPAAPGTAQVGGAAAVADVLAEADNHDEAFPTKGDRRRKWAHSDRYASDPPAVAVAVPIAFFLFVLGLVAVILVINFRKDRLRHETLRLIVERGGEIPTELLAGPRKRPSSDLRKGVILIACGVGLGLFLALVASGSGQDRHAWSMGFIPALIGLGYLLVWRLERRGADEGSGPAGSLTGAGPSAVVDAGRAGKGDLE